MSLEAVSIFDRISLDGGNLKLHSYGEPDHAFHSHALNIIIILALHIIIFAAIIIKIAIIIIIIISIMIVMIIKIINSSQAADNIGGLGS